MRDSASELSLLPVGPYYIGHHNLNHPEIRRALEMKFPIALLDDLVAIQPNELQISSIRLPDWQKSYHGTVIAKGPNTPELKVGDKVIFGAAVGMESKLGGFAIRIMRESDVEAIVP